MNPCHIAIRNPASIFIFVMMIILIGTSSYRTIPREAAPDVQIPILIVTVPYPGAAAEDVENLVTRKLEQELQNVSSLKEMTSVSSDNASTVILTFQIGFDVQDARTKTRERLDRVQPDLPSDAEDAHINEVNLSEEPMLIVSLSGDLGLEQMKDIAEDLKEDIETIPGILEVDISGGREREVKIFVDADKLNYYRTSLNQISETVEQENTSIPAGILEVGPSKSLIRVPSEFKDPQEINDVVVGVFNQAPVRVRDLGRVVFGYRDEDSISRLNGEESVSLNISKRIGANLLKIGERIDQTLELYRAQYGKQVTITVLADEGKFVRRLVSDLENNIVIGFILVFVVLFLFMGIRNALLVATAIPMSFLLAIIVMDSQGFTLNFVVLFSLILSLGMLVDNAIVVVENIYRHVQTGKPKREAALAGISEVAIPVITSTFTTLAAFGPLIFMPGIVGQFISYMPKTLIFTLSASLIVGLFISPVLCSTLMARPRKSARNENQTLDELEALRDSRVLQFYGKLLSGALRVRWLVILLGLVTFFLVLGLYANTTLKRKGTEFFPSGEPETADVIIRAAPGTTLDASDEYARIIEQHVTNYESSIVAYVSNVGSGTRNDQGTHVSTITMEFPDWREWDLRPSQVVRELRESAAKLAGATLKVGVSQAGPPREAAVNIELRGDIYSDLIHAADIIKRNIQNVEGLVDLADNFERNRDEIRVQIDREKSARLGFNSESVARTVRTAFNGREVSKFRKGKDEYSIVVRLEERFREYPQQLGNLRIASPSGALVPLSEIARIEITPALGSIRHVGLDRVITVSAAAEGLPGPVVLSKARSIVEALDLPESVSLSYTGESEDLEESQAFLLRSFTIALLLIFLVLVTQFNSFAIPLIILSSVMLSLIGVFGGIMIHDRPFTVLMGGIGVISLAGIVVNNAIVLLDFIGQLRKRGYACNEAVVLASMCRLRPVLLTAITTVLGLMPILLGLDINFFRWPVILFGSESSSFWVPMALAIAYGLSVATVLTLFFVPTLYSAVESTRENIARAFSWTARLLSR